MAYYAISYQLNDEKDYQSLWDAFKDLDSHKVMNSVYFVEVDDNTSVLLEHFNQFIDEDDHLAVIPMTERPCKHRCYTGTKAWIDARFI